MDSPNMVDPDSTSAATVKAAGRLQLRDDLIIVEQRQSGRPCFVVKDPKNGKFYRFNQASHRVLQALKQETSPQAFLAQTSEPRQLEEFLARIGGLGLLLGVAAANSEPDRPSAKSRLPAWLRNLNPLFIRLPAFNPSWLLKRLNFIATFLFSRAGLVTFAACVALALGMVIHASGRFWYSFIVFRFFHGWMVAYLLLSTATVLHEFGHGMACQRFGGEVREMGFMIYLLQALCYTNVTDAWLFPKQLHRIVVSLGGIYIEAFLWCAGIAIWFFSRPYGRVSNVVFVTVAVLSFRILINLIPFIRLDGYFVLADLLGINNLGQRSLAAVIGLIPRWGASKRLPASVSARERAILLGYGVLSILTVVLLMYASLYHLHMRMSQSRHGQIYFAILLLLIFGPLVISYGRQVGRLWRKER